MALNFLNSQGSLNGVTAVEVVSALSGVNARVVRQLYVFNRDTADVTVTLYRRSAGTDYYMDRIVNLPAGDSWRVIDGDDVTWLIDDTQSLRLVMSGAPATTQPQYTASYFDRS